MSVVTPTLVAFLICLLEARGPLAPSIQRTTGLVGPYFTAVAILFGLFTTQLMNEVWQKQNAVRQTIDTEDDAMREIFRLARVTGIETMIVPHLKAYAESAAKENPYTHDGLEARAATDKSYEGLLASVVRAPGLEAANRTALMNATEEMRRNRDRRLYLADDATVPIKWLSILVLGALTQIAILLVHVGNRRAIRVSVSLFTIAFTFCLVIVAIFDTPFAGVMSNEPGATFARTLKNL
jgi:hypothetical protein